MTFLALLAFFLFGLFIPGYVLVKRIQTKNVVLDVFLSLVLGMVLLTLVSYLGGIINTLWLSGIYIAVSGLFFLKDKFYLDFKKINFL